MSFAGDAVGWWGGCGEEVDGAVVVACGELGAVRSDVEGCYFLELRGDI